MSLKTKKQVEDYYNENNDILAKSRLWFWFLHSGECFGNGVS